MLFSFFLQSILYFTQYLKLYLSDDTKGKVMHFLKALNITMKHYRNDLSSLVATSIQLMKTMGNHHSHPDKIATIVPTIGLYHLRHCLARRTNELGEVLF